MPGATRSYRTRFPVKQRAIVRELRGQIIAGQLQPGAQLAVRSTLEKQFGVSSNTLQRAFDQLIAEGFIVAQGTTGTYVAQHPPHLAHYAVLVPHQLEVELTRNRFTQTVLNEAARRDAEGPCRFPIYYVGSSMRSEDEVQRLTRDIEDHRLAGLLFLVAPTLFEGTPLLDAAYPGRAAVNAGNQVTINTIRFDWRRFMERALNALAQRGRKRVALITGPDAATGYASMWQVLARQRKLETKAPWIQGTDIFRPHAANHLAQLLMHCDQSSRPDGLVVADDNLVEHTAAGLLAAGVRMPADLDVIAHCNFPWPPPSAVPMLRLGFDARTVFDKCIALIDAQREHRLAGHDTIEPVFESDLADGALHAMPLAKSGLES